MTGKILQRTQRMIGLFTILLVMAGTNALALQDENTEEDAAPAGNQPEEKISTLSDYLYNKDYKRFEEIKAVTDNQKKIDLLTAFLKERPISRVLLYTVTEYMVSVGKIAGTDTDKAIAMQEALWKLVPTDQQIAAEAKDIPAGLDDFKKQHLLPARNLVLKSLAYAYFQKKNYAKAAELGEKAYAITPDKATTQIMFSIYNQLGNEDKIVSYGQNMLKAFTLKESEGYSTALQLANIYLKKNNIKAATQLLSQLMSTFGNSVPPNIQESDWNNTRVLAYSLMARDAYNQKDYPKAEQLFQKVLTYDSRLDEPYYFLGMCRWNSKDQKGAITYFARCFVLNKTLAAKAKKYLDDLYKAEYPNAPEGGVNEVIAKAKSDLGIR